MVYSNAWSINIMKCKHFYIEKTAIFLNNQSKLKIRKASYTERKNV